MLGFVDATKRPLPIPARFVPYLEKHHIYELFYELGRQLVIKKPEDHIVYLKQCLPYVSKNLAVPRIIVIAPPHFDRLVFAEVLQTEIGVRPITINDLRKVQSIESDKCHCDESENLAMNMKSILRTNKFDDCGWILVDVPRTKREARAFQGLGIIPTHVIEIKTSDTLGCPVDADSITNFHAPLHSSYAYTKSIEYRNYMKNVRGLREAYADVLIEIERGIRSIEDLGKDCAVLTKMRKHLGAPSIFRIVLLGRRGSGCRSLAKYLSCRFNLVYVDFDYILEQARIQDTILGNMLRLFEHRWGQRPKPETRIQVVEKYLLRNECLNRGWILTRYPISVEDFKLLDMIATPPNRVIILEVDEKVCRERILSRRYNIVTGSKHNLLLNSDEKNCDCDLGIHPNDQKNIFDRDIQEYEENIEGIMQYAKESAVIIDGNAEETTVREKLEACLMRPAPFARPRRPRSPKMVDPIDVQFDPDDEPDHHIFDTIRKRESTYSFV